MKADLLRLPVLHADETPVAMLAPGTGKTHRAYLWAYTSGAFETMRAVVYDFTESRSGQHSRTFLSHGTECAWKGSLVCDDYAGYKALFLDGGTKEMGCMAHARRKFVELHLANKSTLAATAIEFIGQLYGIEREVKALAAQDRLRERQTRAAPVAQAWSSGRRCRMARRLPRPWTTACAPGRRSRVTLATTLRLSTTISTNSRSGPGPRAARTGSSPGHCSPGNGPRPS